MTFVTVREVLGSVRSFRRAGRRECRNSFVGELIVNNRAPDENSAPPRRAGGPNLFRPKIRAKTKGNDSGRSRRLRLADLTLNRATSASTESFSRYFNNRNYFLELRNRFALLRLANITRLPEITQSHNCE